MKKKSILVLYILISLYLSIFIVTSYAATPTTTPVPTDSTQTQINDLTNRIASRVAQLRLVEKRGIIGKVTDVSNTQITITDIQQNTRFIDVDEFTKFSSPSAKSSFGISDITKGSTIGVLGLYNKESRRILARFVDVLNLPEFIHGYISSIDSKNFSLNVVSENGTPLNVDVATSTITLSYNTGPLNFAKSGFSKLKEEENVIVIGFYDLRNKNQINASKIIALPDIPKNPKIKTPIQSPTPTISAIPKAQ